MSAPTVTAVTPASPAARAGLEIGDHLVSLNGTVPRDVIEFHQITDGTLVDVVVQRPGAELPRRLTVHKQAGEPFGIEVSSAVFDRIRTCDNHCAFCFIYQLPKGMRRSLYVKDDDYRLSFLYGNFTTLTRFTELDLERVVTERLGPLFVSIHATDPDVRSAMLRNPKGATSLRWLRRLLEAGIEIHGQVVVCPGINDGDVLEDTFAGILDRYPALASVGVVPLGVSRFSHEPDMRPHTHAEAEAVVDSITRWQATFAEALGRRMVHAADEYYLMADRPMPTAAHYDGYPQHENGIGMARSFAEAFAGDSASATGIRHGFFAAVDGAPPAGYRAPRTAGTIGDDAPTGSPNAITVLTGAYGARVLEPLVATIRDARPGTDVEVLAIENDYFGGNIGVSGLITGTDLARVLADQPEHRRYLLPDACLSGGRFLDGTSPHDLPRPVEILPSDGASLRRALERPGTTAHHRQPVTIGAGAGAAT